MINAQACVCGLLFNSLQKEKEARSWRHKWFKLDKVAHSSRASSEPSLTPPGLSPENSGVHKDPAPIAAATAAGAAVAGQLQPGCSLTSASAQCASNGGSQQGTEHATTAAVAAETAEDEQHASEVLSLLGAHLLELVSSIYPQTSAPAAVEAAASSAEAPGQAVGATSAELWNGGEARLCESLNELVAVCQPRLSRVGLHLALCTSLLDSGCSYGLHLHLQFALHELSCVHCIPCQRCGRCVQLSCKIKHCHWLATGLVDKLVR